METAMEGLSEAEVVERVKSFGKNEIKEYKKLGKIFIWLNQLKSPLILALIITGGITFFLKEWLDATVIFGAVIVNSALGFWQENKSEAVMESLKSYVRVKARVKRSDEEHEIDASSLVPGDVIRLTVGARVPADARIIFSNNLEADESVLTGESLLEAKNAVVVEASARLAERTSMLYTGTLVVHGMADAVVVATGYNTEFGQIAELLGKNQREQTPLQKTINDFTLKAGAALVLVIGAMLLSGFYAGYNLYDIFLIAVAAAVSSVPEGLPIALTVILAIGVQRLAKKGGIIRKLLAAETLGSTTIILTDKTGTLTEAKMAVESLLPYKNTAEKELLKAALINTDVIVEREDEILGNPVEVAIFKTARSFGLTLENLKLIDKLPFSSETKFTAVNYEEASRKKIAIFGAPEIILKHTKLGENEKIEIIKKLEEMAYSGKRVLGAAEGDGNKIENLNFLGLIALKDPVRKGVKEAILRIAETGVKTIIVTGDHKGTAEAVARELGLVDGKGAILTGEDMAHLPDEELKNRIYATTVFARTVPQDKLRLVKILKENGEIVAVTGDGVNDALALEAADIGVAVEAGTDVAKNSSDLILLDNNFSTLVAAIEEGKRILGNIRKVIVYLLSNSLDELFLIGGSIAMGLELPLNALQILFVNFFSDSFPAVAFAFEEGVDGWKDKEGSKKIFDKKVKFLILIIGIFTSALLLVFYWGLLKLNFDQKLVRTFIFAAFATYTLFLAFSIRSLEKGIMSYNPGGNKFLTYGLCFGLFLTASVIYIPFLQEIFGLAHMPLMWLFGVVLFGVFNILLVEFSKWLFRKKLL